MKKFYLYSEETFLLNSSNSKVDVSEFEENLENIMFSA